MNSANGVAILELPASLMGGGPSTIYPTLIWDNHTTILVDTGYPKQMELIRKAIEDAGVSLAKLSKIIITHHDMDHIGSLRSLVNELSPKIEVYAHADEKPYIEAKQPPIRLLQLETIMHSAPAERREQIRPLCENLRANYKNFQATVDKTLTDGEELPFCGGITVIHTPGHTPGHICLYLKKSKILIAGDVLNVENRLLVAAPQTTTLDKPSAAASLKKLSHYDIDTIICYHSGIYNDNVNKRIAEIASEVYTATGC